MTGTSVIANPQLRHNMHYPDTTMAYWAPSMAALYGDRLAVVDGERTCTFRELGQRSAQFAGALRQAGVGVGDVVLMHLGNCVEFLQAYYGCLQAGATVTLVNPLQPELGLRKQIEETSAVAAVTQSSQLHVLLAAASGTSVRTIVMVQDTEGALDTPESVVAFDSFIADLPTEFTPASGSKRRHRTHRVHRRNHRSLQRCSCSSPQRRRQHHADVWVENRSRVGSRS